MDYVDYTLVRLADDSLRAALFDQSSLAQIASAAYDADAMALGPPYSAAFDQVTAGVSVPRRSTAEAIWGASSGMDRREGRVTVFGIGSDPVRVDALWRGAIVANAISPMARIARVIAGWPDVSGIDADIVKTLGSLPTDSAVLEAERRRRFLARLRAGFKQPEALTDAIFDAWLARLGAHSVSEAMTRLADQLIGGTFQIQYAPSTGTDAPAPASPRPLPISAAILIRDKAIQVSQLVADSKLVLDQMKELGFTPAPAPDAIPRYPVLVVWMLPLSTFDDADWPGGETATTDDARRALRRTTAGRWLAREGIALVTTSPHDG